MYQVTVIQNKNSSMATEQSPSTDEGREMWFESIEKAKLKAKVKIILLNFCSQD